MSPLRDDKLTSRTCPDCGGRLVLTEVEVAAFVWQQVAECEGCGAVFSGPLPPYGREEG